MTLKVGDVFAKKYVIWGLPPDVGGMGRVLFVHPISNEKDRIALKFCKDPALYERFKREVTILKKYAGNSKVIQILSHDLESKPPYFTMPYSAKGDVYTRIERIKIEPDLQEKLFYKLIDAISELHANGDIHRDIKPQNFLIFDKSTIVVSDFGLAKLGEGASTFTRTMDAGGTTEYAPPEFFQPGGFKTASVGWDIFSLGKTIYRLCTDRHAQHLTPDGIPPSLMHVIRKCCEIDPKLRYRSLSELRQALSNSYDIILGRLDAGTDFTQSLERISRALDKGKFNTDEVNTLLEALPSQDEEIQIYFADNLPSGLLGLICGIEKFDRYIPAIVDSYALMLTQKENHNVNFAYAEVVANEMKTIFDCDFAPNALKGRCLRFAIDWSIRCNRFAAMDTCIQMIKSVFEEELGMLVADLIEEFSASDFITSIEPSACKSQAVKRKLLEFRTENVSDDDWF